MGTFVKNVVYISIRSGKFHLPTFDDFSTMTIPLTGQCCMFDHRRKKFMTSGFTYLEGAIGSFLFFWEDGQAKSSRSSYTLPLDRSQ